jgi:hypothetical protein
MRRFAPGLLTLAVVLFACGSPALTNSGVQPVEFTEADEACVDFYRAVQESVEEEAVYMREFANRISELGYDEAAVILSDLAGQWEFGTWEAGQDEVWQSAIWADAGALLGSAGAVRCTDLAEWWEIDGYQGEPDPKAMLERQASIWSAIDVDDYYLLVARSSDRSDLTQAHVQIKSGDIAAISEIDPGSYTLNDLPQTVDEAYSMLLNGDATSPSYDLVWSSPRTMQMKDGSTVILVLDIEQYPEPLDELGELEGEAHSG